MVAQQFLPLPASLQECRDRGWQEIDIVLVSGDAYVDHPSFGLAVIGRLLEQHGYRVAVLAQPTYNDETDFHRFGRPRLFFGISAGNLDSIVANYSGNGKVRDFDAFSPGGSPWRPGEKSRENRWRPDRAVLIYTNLAKRAHAGIPVIIGGVEASLRRFVHFDYQQNRMRGSHLTDAKADLLIYGMAETAVIEAAHRIDAGRSLEGIPGSCLRADDRQLEHISTRAAADGLAIEVLPSWQQIGSEPSCFMAAEKSIDRHARAADHTVLLQRQQAGWLVHYPPAPPLTPAELDRIYQLPFSRKPHPLTPYIPAYEMVKSSITIVRGCSGNCSFCAIARHQGPMVTSRSIDSILSEVRLLAADDDFSGTISDLGGPTANLFGTRCAIGSCRRHDCLFPSVCKHLLIDEQHFIELLERVMDCDAVEHAYISSGLRLELLLKTPKLLERIIRHHTPGTLKIAPEHTDRAVLQLMHKEAPENLEQFVTVFRALSAKWGKKHGLTPYIISAHPGCGETETVRMIDRLRELGLVVRKFQDFTPTPGTLSTAMYVTGVHRDHGTPITVARGQAQRTRLRLLIERAFLRNKGAPERREQQSRGTAQQRTRQTNRRKRSSSNR
jgi:uncharacterized radical SAM protein YgiQ